MIHDTGVVWQSVAFLEALSEAIRTTAGVLESPEDFESSEELYEAVGAMIEGAVGEGEERDVHVLCQQLFSIALGYVCCYLYYIIAIPSRASIMYFLG